MKFALLLTVLTLGIVLLPLLPAFREWWKPTDVTPLPIDETDALEPQYLARRFSGLIGPALDKGLIELGGVPLVYLPANTIHAPWPLNAQEVRTNRTRRIWHTDGDCVLPERLHCLAEMSARGSLRTAAGRTYRALLSGAQLTLAPHTRVIRWAHAQNLAIGDHCQLPGRISATQALMLGREVSFSLLHAPAIRFAGQVPTDWPVPPDGRWSIGASDGVLWDAASNTGRVPKALHVPPLRRWRGDLVCDSHLSLGEGCEAEGSLRTAATLNLGAGCRVHGGLVAPGEIYLAAGTEVRASIVSETLVVLGAGCVVGVPGAHATVRAPRVEIGKGVVVHGTVWSGQHQHMRTVGAAQDEDLDPMDEQGLGVAVRWNAVSGRGLANADLKVPPLRQWSGDLVCQGDLELGARCHVRGSLKAYGDLGLGPGVQVDGSVVAQGDVLVGAGSHVGGSVVSETAVVLGPGCTVGTPERHATVCAPRIEVALGVVVHGTVWAGASGDAFGSLQIGADVDLDDHLPDLPQLPALPGRAAA
ncbi:MAG: hypothetical protein KAX42_08860 [Sphaerotilus sp.]|nr:hypothetical protein [Sphaerotilus sp.]